VLPPGIFGQQVCRPLRAPSYGAEEARWEQPPYTMPCVSWPLAQWRAWRIRETAPERAPVRAGG